MEFQETMVGELKEIPSRIVLYGREKGGKTTLACEAPDAFLIDIENGAQFIKKKVRATPHLRDFDSVTGWLRHIYESDTFKAGTIIIDSLDHLEDLAQARLIKLNNAKTITDPSIKAFAYHRGVVDAANDAANLFKWCDAIWEKKKIKTIIIAHSTIKEIDLPGQVPFSRYQLKLSKQLGAKAKEWCDALLHLEYSFNVSADGKTLSEPKPVLFTGGDMSYEGGGRIALPKSIPASYKALEEAIKKS